MRRLIAAVLAVTACTQSGGNNTPDATAQAQVALSSVPSDVRCVDVLVLASGHTVDQRFDVTPGASATLTIFAPPDAQASISAQAFAGACSAVVANTPPTWVADPVTAALAVGEVAQVHLHMRRPSLVGTAQVTVDFPDDFAGLLGAGGGQACVVKQDGTVACWGSNMSSSAPANNLTPVAVSNLSGVKTVAVGSNHVCALKSDGTVGCWGSNSSGQLGNNATSTSSAVPLVAGGLTGITALAANDQTNCAIKQDGTVVCWGLNSSHVLGANVAASTTTPVAVSGLTGAVAVAGCTGSFCALKTDGTVACWGSQSYQILGSSVSGTQYVPVAIAGLSAPVTALSMPNTSACALLADATVQCWGEGLGSQVPGPPTANGTPTTVAGLAGVVALGVAGSGEAYHECVVKSDGSVSCWGYNPSGQLGNNSTTTSATPSVVPGISTAKVATMGINSSCVMLSDHSVSCWGSNSSGQLGNNSTVDSKTPVRVVGLP